MENSFSFLSDYKGSSHRALDEPRPQVDGAELNYRREYDDHHGTRRAAKYERRVAHDARKWDLRNENVYAALLRSVKHHVEANLLASATKFGEGCALWTRLVQRFEPKDQTILQAELAKFNRLEQNPNEKATDFVTRIETSRQILAGFDFVVNPNVEMLNRVKHGLTSPEYDSFRMALFMVDDLTWDKAVSKIKAFDTDIKAGMKRKQGDLVEAGLTTSKYCPKCRATSHNPSECWKLHPQLKPKTQKRAKVGKKHNPNIICFNCNQPGHPKKFCPKARNSSNSPSANIVEVDAFMSEVDGGDDETGKRMTRRHGESPEAGGEYDSVIDSGATHHIINVRRAMTDFRDAPGIVHLGRRSVELQSIGVGKVGFIEDAICCPSMSYNLISVNKLTDSNFAVVFENDNCILRKGSKTFLRVPKIRGLYRFNLMDILSHEVVVNIASAEPDDKLTLWHNRFGHAYIGALTHGVKKGKVRGITLKDNELAAKRLPIGLCDICARAKSHRGSFNIPASPKADVVGGWISADIQGPFATEDMDGNRYVLTLTDWYSRWSWSFLLRNKGDAENHIKKVVDVLVPQMGYAVKHYHTDGAHELLSKSLEEWMNSGDRRISTTVAPPSTPQLNANSERGSSEHCTK